MGKVNATGLITLILAAAAYKYRYRLLNMFLENDTLRKFSVNTAMSIPGVRSRFIESAFRK